MRSLQVKKQLFAFFMTGFLIGVLYANCFLKQTIVDTNLFDIENLKKRLKTEHANQLKYAMQSFIEELLPVIDNYERSLTVEPESEEAKNILKGNKMILNQLMNILGKNGVTVIEAQGKEFDPNIHQAVMQDDNPDFGPNIVTEELQKGYMLKDRVIRATLVKVNKD